VAAVSVALLWCEGCPSTEAALAQLRDVLAELGHGDTEIAVRQITSDEEADAEQFIGSPTIHVDGVDPLAPPAPEPAALSCRVYRLRDGRPSPTPDREDLRAALAAALA
jgi:hypothetical protein